MATTRNDFSHRQKAEIFARDRAICCFSGASLWLLDYGAAPSSVDWADHITACVRGGKAEIANGACASARYNWVKRQHGSAIYLFEEGRPTADFFEHHETVSEQIALHLRRFATLQWEDWYFNRALFRVLVCANTLGERRMDGKRYARGFDYWAAAALKSLEQWRRAGGSVASMRERGLIPKRQTADQTLLLSLKDAKTVTSIKRVIAQITPYVRASRNATLEQAEVQNLREARALLASLRSNRYVVPRTRAAIRTNIERLYIPS